MVLLANSLGYRASKRSVAARDTHLINGHPATTGEQWVGELSRLDASDEGVVWRTVREVTTRFAQRDERVWDLTVEDDESYVVGMAAVHNCHRIGQDNPSLYTTLIASGTLDEPIQRILNRKTRVLERAIGDTDDSVAVLDDVDAAPLTEIVKLLVEEAVSSHRKVARSASR